MRALAATLLALAGFAGTSVLLGLLLEGSPELRLAAGSTERQKLEHFQASGADYDLVYVGTSRVLRGFDPRAFDARTAELGCPTRSYNFGLRGLGYLEELFLVDWILEQRPEGLRWLLIEPADRDVLLHRANLFTQREIHWHTPDLTGRGLRAAWESERDLAQKLELTRVHLLYGAHRLCNIGVGSALLARLLAKEAPRGSRVAGFVGRSPGKNAAEPDEPEARAERERPPTRLSAVLHETLAELAPRARDAGVRPLFVIPPTTKPLGLFHEAQARGALPSLHTYTPSSFPEIFAGDYFYDQDHLDTEGARLFSRRLAEDFAALQGASR